MAKINIAGVKSGINSFVVHVVLTKKEKVGEEIIDSPLGEAFPEFPNGAKPATVKQGIIKAAEGIRERAREARQKRVELEKVEFPEIEE